MTFLEKYKQIKSEYPEVVMFFEMGDFYELFYDDAKLAAKILGLTLLTRDKDGKIPMAGFPHHQLHAYLTKMIKNGFRVSVVNAENSVDNPSN